MPKSVSVIITAALVFYSIGVWGEKITGRLKAWHFILFCLGLVCDTIGTGMMFDFVGGMKFDIHGITGLIAILLMIIHAAWALIVLLRKNEKMIRNFHKFSIFVWLVWLVPYFSPMIASMFERFASRG